MSLDEEVSRSELFELVHYFSKNPFRTRDTNSKVTSCTRNRFVSAQYVGLSLYFFYSFCDLIIRDLFVFSCLCLIR